MTPKWRIMCFSWDTLNHCTTVQHITRYGMYQGEWLDLANEDAARRLQWLPGGDPSTWPPPPPSPHPPFEQRVDNALLLAPAGQPSTVGALETKETRPVLTLAPPAQPAPPLEEAVGWRIGTLYSVLLPAVCEHGG